MNQRRKNQFATLCRVWAFLDETRATWESVEFIGVAHSELEEIIDSVTAKENKIRAEHKKYTAHKNQLKEAVREQALVVQAILRTYNRQHEIGDSHNLIGKPADLDLRKKEWLFEKRAMFIATQAGELATALAPFGLTRETLDSFTTLLNQYATARREASHQLKYRESRRGKINDLLNQGMQVIHQKISPLMALFKGSNPEFYNQFFRIRKVTDAPKDEFNGLA